MEIRKGKALAAFVALILLVCTSEASALDGTNVSPGSACSTEDAVMISANPGGSGGYVLTCESGTWVAQFTLSAPTANAHVANKEYVDTAVASAVFNVCTDNATGLCVLETTRDDNDPHFTAENIKNGVNILGVTGSYTGGGGGGGLCSAPPLCPNVGDVCDDSNAGTTNDPIFAGCANYGGSYEPLFVSNNNQSTSSDWKISTGVDDIATDHFDDGKLNDAQVPNSTDFPAFKLCKDLTDGGYSDWYLPARTELDVLWQNRTAINANAAGDLTTSYYWSSTEFNSTSAWRQVFSNGSNNNTSKSNSNDVRCVRRE